MGEVVFCYSKDFAGLYGRICIGYRFGFSTPGTTVSVPLKYLSTEIRFRLACNAQFYGCVNIGILSAKIFHMGAQFLKAKRLVDKKFVLLNREDCHDNYCWGRRRMSPSVLDKYKMQQASGGTIKEHLSGDKIDEIPPIGGWSTGLVVTFSVGVQIGCTMPVFAVKARAEVGATIGPFGFDQRCHLLVSVWGRACISVWKLTVCVLIPKMTFLDHLLGFPVNAVMDFVFMGWAGTEPYKERHTYCQYSSCEECEDEEEKTGVIQIADIPGRWIDSRLNFRPERTSRCCEELNDAPVDDEDFGGSVWWKHKIQKHWSDGDYYKKNPSTDPGFYRLLKLKHAWWKDGKKGEDKSNPPVGK